MTYEFPSERAFKPGRLFIFYRGQSPLLVPFGLPRLRAHSSPLGCGEASRANSPQPGHRSFGLPRALIQGPWLARPKALSGQARVTTLRDQPTRLRQQVAFGSLARLVSSLRTGRGLFASADGPFGPSGPQETHSWVSFRPGLTASRSSPLRAFQGQAGPSLRRPRRPRWVGFANSLIGFANSATRRVPSGWVRLRRTGVLHRRWSVSAAGPVWLRQTWSRSAWASGGVELAPPVQQVRTHAHPPSFAGRMCV